MTVYNLVGFINFAHFKNSRVLTNPNPSKAITIVVVKHVPFFENKFDNIGLINNSNPSFNQANQTKL